MGTQLPFLQMSKAPKFLTHVYCGQTDRGIKMPLGMEVGLGPGHIVLDRDPVLLPKGAQPSIFGPRLLWPNGWMDQDGTVMEVGLGPGHIVLDGDPAPLPQKRA